jgi:phosphatidylglycerol---prolipoprotein diacylglyceryl transferase
MFVYPNFDPVAFAIGPVQVRWYGLMYLLGFLAAWWLARWRSRRPGSTWTAAQVDDLIFFCAIGVILGGRLGWMLIYGTKRLFDDPLSALRIWEGGMSFHGGLAGVVIALVLFARSRGKRIADAFDFTMPLPAIGFGAGRIGNFINGELWGKPTDVPWGFVVDPEKLYPLPAEEALRMCRRFGIDPCVLHVHASQLYEGLLEGLVLFVILWVYTSKPRPRLAPSGLFLICYGVFRFGLEFVRVPDENRGYLLFSWMTMGQILSAPMIIAGLVLLAIAYQRRVPSGNLQTA